MFKKEATTFICCDELMVSKAFYEKKVDDFLPFSTQISHFQHQNMNVLSSQTSDPFQNALFAITFSPCYLINVFILIIFLVS